MHSWPGDKAVLGNAHVYCGADQGTNGQSSVSGISPGWAGNRELSGWRYFGSAVGVSWTVQAEAANIFGTIIFAVNSPSYF